MSSLAPLITRNTIPYRKLEKKVSKIAYGDGSRPLVHLYSGAEAFNVQMNNNVLMVQVESNRPITSSRDVIRAVINKESTSSDDGDMQGGTMMQFHQRMAHIYKVPNLSSIMALFQYALCT